MRLRLLALLTALPLAAGPAAATVYYDTTGQADFFAANPPTPSDYSGWSLTFSCPVDSDPCAPSFTSNTYSQADTSFTSAGGFSPGFVNNLALRSGAALPPAFDYISSDTTSAIPYFAASITVQFANPTDAVGFMLARGTQGSGNMTVDFLRGTSVIGSVTRIFADIANFRFIGTDGIGPITGMTVSVPAPNSEEPYARYVAIGPIQFGQIVDVPEPASLTLLGAGLLGLGLVRRYRQSAAKASS